MTNKVLLILELRGGWQTVPVSDHAILSGTYHAIFSQGSNHPHIGFSQVARHAEKFCHAMQDIRKLKRTRLSFALNFCTPTSSCAQTKKCQAVQTHESAASKVHNKHMIILVLYGSAVELALKAHFRDERS
jgi:hypothetical protein